MIFVLKSISDREVKEKLKLIKRTFRITGIDDDTVKKHKIHHGSESAVVRFALRHLLNCKQVHCEIVQSKSKTIKP